MSKCYSMKVEDLFEDIEGDPDNVTMMLTDEMMKELGVDIGDFLMVDSNDYGIVIRKKDETPSRAYQIARAALIDENVPPEFE
jgi:antitoxin component of MazEF toxin-antitoxin module